MAAAREAALRLLLLPIALSILASPARGTCSCECVNGEKVPLCSSSLDIPPPCVGICPMAPPRIPPIDPVRIPPVGARECHYEQVLSPSTDQYEWRTVCW